MLRFACKPEGSIDALSVEPTEIFRIWLDLGMFFLLEGAHHETMGRYSLVHSYRPNHVEIVRFAHTSLWGMATSLLRGLFQSTSPRLVDG